MHGKHGRHAVTRRAKGLVLLSRRVRTYRVLASRSTLAEGGASHPGIE